MSPPPRLRVGVIGTGSTASQLIPPIAEQAAQLQAWGSAPCAPARAWLPELLERQLPLAAERVALQHGDGGERCRGHR